MKYLIYLEWLKWRRQITFRVLLFLYAVLLPTSLLVTKRWPNLPPPLDAAEAILIFPNVWQYLGFVANWLAFFCFGLLAVFFITMEFNHRTLRQNVMMGLSRVELCRGKWLFILVTGSCATLYYGAWALILGYWHTDLPLAGKVLERAGCLYYVWLAFIGYMSLGLLIGFLIRRTGLAAIVYLSYAGFIELTFRWSVHFNIFPGKFIHYYPVKAFSDLTPFPVLDLSEAFLNRYHFDLVLDPTEASLVSLFYIFIFNLLIYFYLKNSDL